MSEYMVASNILNNESIVSALIGAIAGSIITAILTYCITKYEFNKKKEGAYRIIKSEFEVNLNYLENYYEKYLNHDFEDMREWGTLEDLEYFYRNLEKFSLFTHKNWDNLIEFIPHIFNPNQIEMLIDFYAKLDNLNNQILKLSQKTLGNDVKLIDINFIDFYFEDYEKTISEWANFEFTFKQTKIEGEKLSNFI